MRRDGDDAQLPRSQVRKVYVAEWQVYRCSTHEAQKQDDEEGADDEHTREQVPRRRTAEERGEDAIDHWLVGTT